MSSGYVRSTIKTYFATQFPGVPLVDFTAEERELEELMTQYSITFQTTWFGIEFVGNTKDPIAVATDTNKGCYRERGSLFFHIVAPVGLVTGTRAADKLVANADALDAKFSGARIGDIIIESITPLNTNAGATLQFEHGFTGGSLIVSYYRDLNL
jgi:hypothetical protein